MRILFYLPVVTPWWFQTIIVPLISKFAGGAEIHVLAPAPWRGTGLGRAEFEHCAHLPDIQWHIVNDAAHPSMRTNPVERAGIVAFVNSLEPDYVLCRSADLETVRAFPGVVRHITEGAMDPLLLPKDSVHFTQQPFDHGVLPALSSTQIEELQSTIAQFWPSVSKSVELDRAQRQRFCEWADLPKDRKILLLPLEYEHEENFFTIHRLGATPNAQLVSDLLERIDDRFFLALTNHPLNDLHVDNSALERLVRGNSSRARLLPSANPIDARTTQHLLGVVDGVLLGDSKVFSLAAFLRTAIMRQSRFKSGDWLNVSDDLEEFLQAVADGEALRPRPEAMKAWFAFHTANAVFAPNDPELTAADLLDRLNRPVNPDRWERNFAYFAKDWRARVPA